MKTTVATRIAIPNFRVPLTLQVLAVNLSGFLLEPSYGVLAQANEIIEHHADLSGDRYRSLQQARGAKRSSTPHCSSWLSVPTPCLVDLAHILLEQRYKSTFIGVRYLPRSAAAQSTIFRQTRRKSRPVPFELSELCRGC